MRINWDVYAVTTLFSKDINKNHVGLYIDEGLAILRNTCGPKQKKFQKLFKEKDLEVTV